MHHRRPNGSGSTNGVVTNNSSNGFNKNRSTTAMYGGGAGSNSATSRSHSSADHLERGSRHGRNGTASSGMSASETNRNIMEQQNNERVSMLSDQVARLKGLTIDIGNEVRDQNRLLDGMEDGFSSTRDMLSGSLRRIGTMLDRGGAKHMCYMVGFVVFVMAFLYWVMTYRGKSGA